MSLSSRPPRSARSLPPAAVPTAWGLALLLALFLGPGSLAGQAPAPQPGDLVDQAWRAVDSTYHDPTFGGRDWAAVRDSFVHREFGGPAEAHDAVRAMLARLGNPATRFLTADQAESLLAEFSGRPHDGVGLLELLSVDTDLSSGRIVVVTPLPGGPAARAGLRPGDVIVAVGGVPARELGLARTMARLRGAPGTAVRVRLARGGDTTDLRLERERIPGVDPVEASVRRSAGTKVGYLGLRQFTPDAPERLRGRIEELRAAGVGGFVLDLRGNPGGFVQAVRKIGGFFLGEGALLARMIGREPEPVPLRTQGKRLVEAPLVALVDRGSASAAEVLAGALRPHDRAVLVGETTFGKGLVHGLRRLADGSAVTPTLGRLETPAGRAILGAGIRPDVTVPAADSPVLDPSIGAATEEDVQYRRAVRLLQGRRDAEP